MHALQIELILGQRQHSAVAAAITYVAENQRLGSALSRTVGVLGRGFMEYDRAGHGISKQAWRRGAIANGDLP